MGVDGTGNRRPSGQYLGIDEWVRLRVDKFVNPAPKRVYIDAKQNLTNGKSKGKKSKKKKSKKKKKRRTSRYIPSRLGLAMTRLGKKEQECQRW